MLTPEECLDRVFPAGDSIKDTGRAVANDSTTLDRFNEQAYKDAAPEIIRRAIMFQEMYPAQDFIDPATGIRVIEKVTETGDILYVADTPYGNL